MGIWVDYRDCKFRALEKSPRSPAPSLEKFCLRCSYISEIDCKPENSQKNVKAHLNSQNKKVFLSQIRTFFGMEPILKIVSYFGNKDTTYSYRKSINQHYMLIVSKHDIFKLNNSSCDHSIECFIIGRQKLFKTKLI